MALVLRGTLCFLFGMLVLHLTISLLFISGFFLSKTELLMHSECNQYPLHNDAHNIDYNKIFKSLHNDNSNNTKCWTQPKYDKIIILIIDALKFDFVSPLMNKPQDIDILYYSHRLSSIHDLLLNASHSSSSSKLFKFISDPPTVTAQRIKGFTSGGLPTFFDVRNSFTSKRIVIDNILYQLKMNGNYNISFMGDDTWNNLYDFKLYFEDENYPYPSFDVYDLYTVDNGCKQHLYDALYNEDKVDKWNILIAHFLGVDHVGHRYHMNHPKMAQKLNEMNDIIYNVTDWIQSYKKQYANKDVLLLVFGDHGMTTTGDHGGATKDETNAALFMHSTKYLYPYDPLNAPNNDMDMDRYRAVTQINIVPTICLLMGVPIPFENIGAIIPEFYIEMNENDNNVLRNSWKDLLKSMSLNAFQVYQYLWTYDHDANSDTFSDFELKQLHNTLMDAVNNLLQLDIQHKDIYTQIEHMKNIVTKFQTFLKDAYAVCRRKWTTFNLHIMAFAICVGLCAVIGLISMSIDMNSSESIQECDITLMIWTKLTLDSDICVFLCSICYIKYFFYSEYPLSDIYYFGQVVFFSVGCHFAVSLCRQYMSCTVDWIHTLYTFDSIALMLLVVVYFQGLFTDTYIRYEPQLVLFMLIATLLMIVVSSFRENNDMDTSSRQRVRSSMIYIIPICLCIRWMGIASLNEMEPDYAWLSIETMNKTYWIMDIWSRAAVILPTFLIPLMLFYLYYTYALITTLAVIQCILSFISESLLLSYWFLIGDEGYLRVETNASATHNNLWLFPTCIWLLLLIQFMFWSIQCRSISTNLFKPPVKHGIAFMMILLIQLLISIAPCLCLVLGPNSHMIMIYSLLCIYFLTKIESPMINDKYLIVINNYELWIGWISYQYLFFVSGHRCDFSQVSVKAAYIGGFDYNFISALILTTMHQISGHLFSFLLIPILLLSRLCFKCNLGHIYDMDLNYVINSVKYNICKYMYVSMTFSTLFVLCSMCNCYIHRRHLLVWDIFAPKIIFDMVHILVIDILSVVSVVLIALVLMNLTRKSSLKLV